MKKKYHSLKKRTIYAMSVIMLLSSIAIFSYSLISKYVVSFKDTSITKSKNIVFTSNYLKDSSTIPIYNVYENSINFKLSNYEDENIEISENNIQYNISTTCGNLSKNTGTLTGNKKSDDIITLKNNNLESCTITANALKPYSKVLKATFNFTSIDETTGYKITDKGYYIILNIFTGNSLEDITIDYSGFAPDNTNSLMSSWTSSNKNTISASSLKEKSNYELKFKKISSTGTYNMNNIRLYSTTIDLDS